MIKTVRKTGVTSTEKSKATISLIHLKLIDTGACKMNETKHIIYESLFLYNTRATHQHFHNYCRFELGNCIDWATELPPSYGLARYAETL
jgi:hypothetical protein